jgi:alpha-beta hydrolase superfamily lysophospholipase
LPDTRHETLNEINRDEAMNRFADWLDRYIPAPS